LDLDRCVVDPSLPPASPLKAAPPPSSTSCDVVRLTPGRTTVVGEAREAERLGGDVGVELALDSNAAIRCLRERVAVVGAVVLPRARLGSIAVVVVAVAGTEQGTPDFPRLTLRAFFSSLPPPCSSPQLLAGQPLPHLVVPVACSKTPAQSTSKLFLPSCRSSSLARRS
jgi:hypothetical protein